MTGARLQTLQVLERNPCSSIKPIVEEREQEKEEEEAEEDAAREEGMQGEGTVSTSTKGRSNGLSRLDRLYQSWKQRGCSYSHHRWLGSGGGPQWRLMVPIPRVR
ncbi:unnamed protein product [Prorocentrum cordatum]|uniref:Uncharacterized protein n=1 Tax=Prorocentrum cordatum TaxID=2364126 RepID=A0ABN9XJS1_9DINO|nr:unnamed protein product [Polarella glacialis]